MVHVKQFFIVTSFLLSGVLAAPLPGDELSTAATDIRVRNDFAIEAREFNDASIVDIEARAKKTKKPGGGSSASKTSASKTSSSSSKTSSSSASKNTSSASKTSSSSVSKNTSSAPKTSSSSVSKNTSSISKTSSGSSSQTSSASGTKTSSYSSSSSSAPACALPTPTKGPRSLERREGDLRQASNQLDIDEDMYVLNANGKSQVTNLSGCTAVFLWDANKIPSIFHIFCSDEDKKAIEAMDKVGSRAKYYSVIAAEGARANTARDAIATYAKNEGWQMTEILQRPYRLGKKKDGISEKLWRLTTTSGSTTVTRDQYDNPHYCG